MGCGRAKDCLPTSLQLELVGRPVLAQLGLCAFTLSAREPAPRASGQRLPVPASILLSQPASPSRCPLIKIPWYSVEKEHLGAPGHHPYNKLVKTGRRKWSAAQRRQVTCPRCNSMHVAPLGLQLRLSPASAPAWSADQATS